MNDPITRIKSPVRLAYTISAGTTRESFLHGLQQRRLVGERCGSCGKVYVPPAGVCPTCAVRTDEDVELEGLGTVTTFCVVNIPFEGQLLEPPYACAHVLLDGADNPMFHLIGGCETAEVHMGMRVRAVWRPDGERPPSLESILYFEPTGEADADFETFRSHL